MSTLSPPVNQYGDPDPGWTAQTPSTAGISHGFRNYNWAPVNPGTPGQAIPPQQYPTALTQLESPISINQWQNSSGTASLVTDLTGTAPNLPDGRVIAPQNPLVELQVVPGTRTVRMAIQNFGNGVLTVDWNDTTTPITYSDVPERLDIAHTYGAGGTYTPTVTSVGNSLTPLNAPSVTLT